MIRKRRGEPKWADGKRKVFTDKELSEITQQIDKLRFQMLEQITTEFTYDDYYELFVPYALKQSFKDAFNHGEIMDWHKDFVVDWVPNVNIFLKVKVTIEKILYGQNRPLVMQHPQLQHTAPTELLVRVTSLINERININVDYSRVDAVVKALNEICSSPSQVRFFLPQIVYLADRGGLNTLCDRLKSNLREIKLLPLSLRTACKKAAITLTQAQLLADVPPRGNTVTGLKFELVPFPINEDGFFFNVKA